MSLAASVLQKVAGVVGMQRVQHRVASRSSDDLVDWLDVGIAGVGNAFSDWRSGGRNPAIDSLGEARVGAATVLMVLEELERRRAAGTL